MLGMWVTYQKISILLAILYSFSLYFLLCFQFCAMCYAAGDSDEDDNHESYFKVDNWLL